MRTVKENLIAAKALIDTPEKWGQEKLEPRPGCYCAAGAMNKICAIGTVSFDMMDKSVDAQTPEGFVSYIQYNDDPATTHADIMVLFNRAIAAQDNK